MPLQIVRNDITRMEVDAIVNAARPSLLGGGGVDGAIHRAAGPELVEECRTLGGCETGQAKITGAYRLPCRYVIHTVGPVWHGGLFGERRKLASCYRSSLELAKTYGCETVAFPLISAGAYGYPQDKAMRVAVDTIGAFLLENDMTVYLVVYGQDTVALGQKLFADVQEYIDDNYVELYPPQSNRRDREEPGESAIFGGARPSEARKESQPLPTAPQAPAAPSVSAPSMAHTGSRPSMAPMAAEPSFDATAALDDLLFELDESFQQMLLRKIDEEGLTDAQCYKKANVDRKLFSKIRKDAHYRPSKPTAIAFAIALELNLRETESLLRKAGYALSRSSKFDVIIRYFIEHENYNIFEINEVLFHYDQSLLGV